MSAIMMSWPAPRGIHAHAFIGSKLLTENGRWLTEPNDGQGWRPNCCSRDSLDGKEGQSSALSMRKGSQHGAWRIFIIWLRR